MNELVSPQVFKWALTILTFGMAGTWFVLDGISLFRLPKKDDPMTRDKRFGYIMGVAIGAIGIYGCLLFHDVV